MPKKNWAAATTSAPQEFQIKTNSGVANPVTLLSEQIKRRNFVPSPEQLDIVDLLQTHNVVVSARPGAGKTATAQAIMAANPGLRILIITYSKRL
jgi:superfamily II DNA or RNA helicase